MKLPEKDRDKEPDGAETPRDAEARRMIQDYIDDLRELIRKLREKLHEDGASRSALT